MHTGEAGDLDSQGKGETQLRALMETHTGDDHLDARPVGLFEVQLYQPTPEMNTPMPAQPKTSQCCLIPFQGRVCTQRTLGTWTHQPREE